MSAPIDQTIGGRSYLNAGQLLFALPCPPGLTRVRARFRRLATTPGVWSEGPGDRAGEVCRASMQGEAGARLFRFLPRPDLPLLRGAPDPPCEVRVLSVYAGPALPERVEAEFEGPVWTAAIRLAKLIGPAPGSGRVWVPVWVDGDPALADPTPRTGRIGLRQAGDRMGVRHLRVRIDNRGLMELGVTPTDSV